MSSRSKVLIAAFVLAAGAALPVAAVLPVTGALAEPLVYDPVRPGYHPGVPAYYNRYRVLAPDWFEHRDTVTLQVGDAVASNKAMQMRDPWPPYVANRNIQFNGVVMDRAIDQYKAGTVPEPEVITATE